MRRSVRSEEHTSELQSPDHLVFQNGLWIVNPGAAGSLVQPTYAVAVLEEGGAVCYLSHI